MAPPPFLPASVLLLLLLFPLGCLSSIDTIRQNYFRGTAMAGDAWAGYIYQVG